MSDNAKRVKASGPPELNQDPRRLKRRRLAAGKTMREASTEAGCSLGLISMLENGRCSARVTTLAALARVYDCRIADLMPPEPKGAAA